MTFEEAKSILNRQTKITVKNSLGDREIFWKDENGTPIAYAYSGNGIIVQFLKKDKDGEIISLADFDGEKALELMLCKDKIIARAEVLRPYEFAREELLKWS